mmetsp:Transcript_105916/g.297810  ORF Transcript_105916/g.297810 Transcript_105916/m.297810 type:complete len:231 (+) Transcript_105916:492-1184(+)
MNEDVALEGKALRADRSPKKNCPLRVCILVMVRLPTGRSLQHMLVETRALLPVAHDIDNAKRLTRVPRFAVTREELREQKRPEKVHLPIQTDAEACATAWQVFHPRVVDQKPQSSVPVFKENARLLSEALNGVELKELQAPHLRTPRVAALTVPAPQEQRYRRMRGELASEFPANAAVRAGDDDARVVANGSAQHFLQPPTSQCAAAQLSGRSDTPNCDDTGPGHKADRR